MTTDYYDYITENYDPCTMMSPFNPHLMSTVFYLVFILGLIGNSTVLWVLLKVMRLKSMTDVCLLNLVLSDLLIVLSVPFWALYNQGYHFNVNIVCKVMAGAYQLGFYSGILFVTLMSVDRYLAIVHAVAALGTRTLRYGAVVSFIIWIVSFFAALPQAIFTEEIEKQCERNYPPESQNTLKLLRNFGENTVGLFFSLPIMIYCYIRILLVLRRMRNSKKGRAMKLIFAIVGVYVVFWVPYNVAVFLQTLGQLQTISSCKANNKINAAVDLTEAIALTHCCVNPVIYAFAGEKFRKCLANVLAKYLPCFKFYQHPSGSSKVSENDTSNTALRNTNLYIDSPVNTNF